MDEMLTSNVWHVPGRDVDLIVDTANGIGPLLPHVDPLTGGKPVIAFATHCHFDHVGGLHEFADRRVHRDDADETRAPWRMRLRREDFPEGTEEMYAYYEVPMPDVAVRAVPSAGFDVAGLGHAGRRADDAARGGRPDRPRDPDVHRAPHAGTHAGLRVPVRRARRHVVLR